MRRARCCAATCCRGLHDYAAALDGLVLQGGNDVAPQSYGETPLHDDWHGDRVRDRYEIDLIRAFVAAGKPVFGICRGLQLLNVAYGGTLLQDINTQHPQAREHRVLGKYEHTTTRSSSSPARGWPRCSRRARARRPTASTTRASRTWRRASSPKRAVRTTA